VIKGPTSCFTILGATNQKPKLKDWFFFRRRDRPRNRGVFWWPKGGLIRDGSRSWSLNGGRNLTRPEKWLDNGRGRAPVCQEKRAIEDGGGGWGGVHVSQKKTIKQGPFLKRGRPARGTKGFTGRGGACANGGKEGGGLVSRGHSPFKDLNGDGKAQIHKVQALYGKKDAEEKRTWRL